MSAKVLSTPETTAADSAHDALAGMQRQFLAHMRGPHNRRATDAFAMPIDDGHLSREIGLKIYLHAYGARLREALEHDHPVLGAYLGDAQWKAMCEGYISAHPSRVRSLRDFGAQLPEYLAHADAFRAHPQIAELALFERRLLDSFDAADDTHAEWNDLLAMPPLAWPTLHLRLHPCLQLHRVACNSVEIWRAIKGELAPPAVSEATSPEWALWRDRDRVGRFRSLDASESAAVAHCQQGGDFAGLCEVLMPLHPSQDVPATALRYFQTWCAEGWIASWE